MRKIREAMRLRHELGMGACQISWSCGVSIPTVREYLFRAEAAGLSWPLPDGVNDEDLEKSLFPGQARKGDPLRPLPDFARVRRELGRKGVTLVLLWQEYRRQHSDGYGLSRFCELYTGWEKKSDVRMLQRHKAGQKLFTDWAGLKIPITDPGTGEIHEAAVFVSAMGSSQLIFAKAYESEELIWWLKGHVESFEELGAVPEIVVPDNLKAGVHKACRYEPVLNPSYAELAQFYEVAVIPARVRKPRDKAKVENAVQQVERWGLAPLRDRQFFSLAEANEALAEKIAEINERVMKGPGLSRKELFELDDKPAMRPLPRDRYEYAEWKRAKLGPDYHVQVDGRLYSAPFTLCGKHVDVRVTVGIVEVFDSGRRVASHLRMYGRRRISTLKEHMPAGHKRHADWTPARVMRWAGVIGPNAAAFAKKLMETKAHPEQGFRACMGLISLEKNYGKPRVEAACAKALALGCLTLRNVKDILAHGLESAQIQADLHALPAHANIRGGSYYAPQEALCAKSH